MWKYMDRELMMVGRRLDWRLYNMLVKITIHEWGSPFSTSQFQKVDRELNAARMGSGFNGRTSHFMG